MLAFPKLNDNLPLFGAYLKLKLHFKESAEKLAKRIRMVKKMLAKKARAKMEWLNEQFFAYVQVMVENFKQLVLKWEETKTYLRKLREEMGHAFAAFMNNMKEKCEYIIGRVMKVLHKIKDFIIVQVSRAYNYVTISLRPDCFGAPSETLAHLRVNSKGILQETTPVMAIVQSEPSITLQAAPAYNPFYKAKVAPKPAPNHNKEGQELAPGHVLLNALGLNRPRPTPLSTRLSM
jgi:hypothetical protein